MYELAVDCCVAQVALRNRGDTGSSRGCHPGTSLYFPLSQKENRMQPTTEKETKTIDVLNSFLRGELSAVETYRQALTKVKVPTMRTQLQEVLQSHESRCELLRNRIVTLGGSPSTSSGPWGTFAKLVEGGA